MNEVLMRAISVSKRFGGPEIRPAVDDLSFQLGRQEVLGLLGPNGAGKTTTIRMLMSILRPSAGDIEYFGKRLADYRSEILSQVAFASTYTNLPLFLTVEEN